MMVAQSARRITVASSRLTTLQRRHAFFANLLPLLATVVALLQAVNSGISRVDLALLAGMYSLTFIGVEIGYHRHFSHHAFRARPWLRSMLAGLGAMGGQGPVTYWVSNHRRHHAHVDGLDDPHSPHTGRAGAVPLWRGLWHAHIGWLFEREVTDPTVFAKDCLRDPLVASASRQYAVWLWAGVIAPGLVGGLLAGRWSGVVSGALWGGLVRLFLVQQATFAVNSVCHVFGTRRFDTAGRDTNNVWLAIPTLGGSWHHNHHAFPYSAVNGLQWWELDLGAWIIHGAAKLGLVWDVKRPSAAAIRHKQSRRS